MESESFEDEGVAKILNERFVSIKVDREERPDIDAIYMSVCQAMTGHGGWPLSIFMTPDQVPFYAGTYFPRNTRQRHPGFIEVITYLYDQYKSNREKIDSVGEQIKEALTPTETEQGKNILSETTLHHAYDQLEQSFDEVYGGFGNAPKFPIPHQLMFLLRYYKWTKEEHALQMVTKTLDQMARGGIYDHIGFGFARYSVDELWLVPHFEKMLYDNALLAFTYTEAFQVTKDPRWQEVAEQILTYVLRDMTSDEGGFYSAEDADSEGEEGKYYVWSRKEVIEHLGPELGELYSNVFDIRKEGNFEGHNLPNLIKKDLLEYSETNGIDYDELKSRLAEARQQLFSIREKRTHPYKDDKVLSAWNGLMIAAFAKASRTFSNQEYINAAKKALAFIENYLMADGRLMVRYRDGEVKQLGFIDDYANLLWGYIEVFESTIDLQFLEKAKNLANQMLDLFWDDENGGFYFYGEDSEELLVRPKEVYDGAMPSGNSVASLQLLRLARLTAETRFEDKVQKLLETFAQNIDRYPSGHSYMLQTLWMSIVKSKEVLIVTKAATGDFELLIETLQKNFYPEVTYLLSNENEQLHRLAPFTKEYPMLDNQTSIYVCENFSCNQPTTNIETALKMIEES